MNQFLHAMEIIFPTTGLFVAIIVCLAVPPKLVKKLVSKTALVTAIGALLFYGYGYANQTETVMPTWVAIIRATFDVLRVFLGSNNWDMVKTAYPEDYQQILFWTMHLAAWFTSASAVFASLGSRLIRKFRLRLMRIWDITIICGLTDNTLDLGRELMENGAHAVLYIDPSPESSLSTAVDHMGGILRSDTDALDANIRFLRSIGLNPGKRKIRVYALNPDMTFNQQYAKHLLDTMNRHGISPNQTALTLLCANDETAKRFLNSPQQCGFGSVLSISEPEMVARMLVKAYPPCDMIDFDSNGAAKNDFHGLVIGFGHIGQAVLKQLVINGQFSGNNLRLAVFAPDYQNRMGLLAHECAQLLEHYDITFHPHDGRSCQMYDYIAAHRETLNYIAVCTGNHAMNMEISEQLRTFLKRRNCKASVYMCSSKGVFHQTEDDRLLSHKIYTRDILCSDRIDRMAMVLHHHYTGSGDMRENWKNCNYFDRMSSRSAADFWYTILRAAGTTMEEAKVNWAPQGPLLENLAKMEHLRWNAFHYTMGFRPMTEEEFNTRAVLFKQAKEKDPNTKYRITKDMNLRLHGCLIPWEKLDEYSRKENAVTGQNRDYCENDRENIRTLKEVLCKMDADE